MTRAPKRAVKSRKGAVAGNFLASPSSFAITVPQATGDQELAAARQALTRSRRSRDQELALALYGRGQVEGVLWRQFAPAAAKAPALFLNRIHRLLEQDRQTAEDRGPVLQRDRNLTGQAAGFTAFDALMLWLALTLQHTGFKRQEIVARIATLRQPLEALLASHIAWIEGAQFEEVDRPSPLLLLRSVERTAPYLSVEPAIQTSFALPIAPDAWFCPSLPFLLATVAELPRERLIIVELGAATLRIAFELKIAPTIRRGRPRELK